GYNTLGTVIEEIRNLSRRLTPPSLGDIGLDEAVKELVAPITASHPVKIRRKIDDIEVASSLQLMIYRVIQEQLHNILKYSHATYVLLTLKKSNSRIILTIIDNGIGFDTAQKPAGSGLFNIKSRARVYGGMVKIVSSPGNGCTIKMSIPLKKNPAA
ncbi:MAG: ATP-binding protein, partial [Bacteroidota bacterium]